MANPRDILVVTTSSVDGLKIKRYIKPVSAHVVAGTNLFSDFFAGITDVFGGRSATYQKQLTSLYNETIERIKLAAHEMGANCIVGLSIDMDEISGKGKSMFMLTAIGTAVVIEKGTNAEPTAEKHEEVSLDKVNTLRTKKLMIEKANSGNLKLNEETWNFIIANQFDEVFPYLLKKYSDDLATEVMNPGISDNFFKMLISYFDSLPEEKRDSLLYKSIENEQNEQVVMKLAEIIQELNLFDFNRILNLLENDNFKIQKRALRLLTYDKPFYNKKDLHDLQHLTELIHNKFQEKGKRTTKKQLLSSKDKEVWTCECGKTNDIDTYCVNCGYDIHGFNQKEIKSSDVLKNITEKITLISEHLKG